MEVADYAFFPTRVLTIQFPNTESLNAELCDLLDRRPELDDKFNTHPDAQNLLRLADTVPAIAQLRSMFLMARGDATIVHNHHADLIGIYYALTAISNRPPIQPNNGEDYFEAGDGVLLLHDPRFNANLTTICNRDHVKVYPRPGLMLIFPAYVWHSVTPHRGDFHRLAFSMNFTLRWPAGAEQQHPLT
jgi:hypothetical protein